MTTKRLLFYLLSWRIGLFIVAFISPLILPSFGNRFPYKEIYLSSTGLPHFLWSFGNFDGVHYLTIAIHSYSAQYIQAFFPFYPLVVGFLGSLFDQQYLLVGITVSTIAFFIGLILFKKLIEIDFSQSTMLWSLVLLLLFPTAFYFGAVYTEGLFFLLTIASFYFARRGKWVIAGMCGGLASATRFGGIFLLPALIVEWWLQNRTRKKEIKSLLLLSFVPLGLLGYMFYLNIKFNDPLLFFHALPNFGTGRQGGIILLPQVFWRYLKIFFSVDWQSLVFFSALTEFLTTIFFSILVFVSFVKTRLSYALFSALILISPTVTGTLTSMPRYVLLCLSAFMTLGMLRSKKLKIVLCLIFLCLLLINMILFCQGYWVA